PATRTPNGDGVSGSHVQPESVPTHRRATDRSAHSASPPIVPERPAAGAAHVAPCRHRRRRVALAGLPSPTERRHATASHARHGPPGRTRTADPRRTYDSFGCHRTSPDSGTAARAPGGTATVGNSHHPRSRRGCRNL